MTALRTLAFGDGSVWGASWSADGSTLTALGTGSEASVVPGVRLPDSGAGAGEEWRLESDGVSLLVCPAGDPVDVQTTQDGLEGWDQISRVTGRFGDSAVDCLGLRSSWSDAVDLTRFESIRAVSVWFDPAEAFAITAFRPCKAKGHGGDLLAGAVIAADGFGAIEDPRLSTTYSADGWPSRAGLELWPATAGEGDSERVYPRRASGEAVGPRAQEVAGGLELRAEPFRWHSRARDGSGMYILARRR